MFKIMNEAVRVGPNIYNFFSSESRISEKRKNDIEERRGQLKIKESDPEVLKIVIEEMLAYKPNMMTLHDRYLQLEQILDAIDAAKKSHETDNLVLLCAGLARKIALSPGTKNCLLARLEVANTRTLEFQTKTKIQSKL